MERQYVYTERAHFMCPNMHFGIIANVKAKYNNQKVNYSCDIMAKAHPFLRSIIKYEDGSERLYYKILEKSMIEINIRESEETLWEDYKGVSTKEWNVLENGLLKIFIYPIGEMMKILFIAHHLLGDGRCLLELVNEFVNLYAQSIESDYAPERLIQNIEDLPYKSELTGVSKYLVKRLNKKWIKEKKSVTYEEYSRFADKFVKENPVSHEIVKLDEERVQLMKKCCKDSEITINDFLMSKLYIGMKTQKVIIAADIRSKLSCYHKGACGNYATAMGIVCKNKNTDVFKKAKEIHKLVQIHMESNKKLMLVLACYLNMEQGLIDATAIATLGGFESKAANFVGSNMFGYLKRDGVSITNLGAISNNNIIEATFIPPVSPATIQTIGVLTVNNKMNLCSSYYKNSRFPIDVKNQLDMLGTI